ncbi:hypothetical protein [Paenarthrobacter nicotinovorans]|uniref:hypothetical protein n=1 Tax=Paenarthrobacter nicotinovorans TaxID=29320 RepID=UPI0007E69F84|nr:hypothetical protein [Paenarthrobacter nicotinovorans]
MQLVSVEEFSAKLTRLSGVGRFCPRFNQYQPGRVARRSGFSYDEQPLYIDGEIGTVSACLRLASESRLAIVRDSMLSHLNKQVDVIVAARKSDLLPAE